jgi:antitoxin Phd
MKIFTFSEARQKLASLLDMVRLEGEVRIKRKDGTVYAIKKVTMEGSPLDVQGTQAIFTAEEIVGYVREGRERG